MRKSGWPAPTSCPASCMANGDAAGSSGRGAQAPAACGSCDARCARAARMKPVNSACPSRGVEVNSGWNCVATNHGWFGSSTTSTRPSREKPEKRMPAWRITEAFIARVPRLAPRLYSLERARHLIQKARAEAGLPKHMTLAACGHGGMTELGDAGLTEPRIMSWCAQETPAPARVYVKRTELQGVAAARKRRQFVERGL